MSLLWVFIMPINNLQCQIKNYISYIFRCSHKWEVLAIIFHQFRKKLWWKYCIHWKYSPNSEPLSHTYIIHSTFVLPTTYLSTPIQLPSVVTTVPSPIPSRSTVQCLGSTSLNTALIWTFATSCWQTSVWSVFLSQINQLWAWTYFIFMITNPIITIWEYLIEKHCRN